MAAQHKRPGRSAKRRRQERALARLIESWGGEYPDYVKREEKALQAATSAPLLPVPAKQSRKLVR